MPCAKPILLVEDDPVDASAIRRALAETKVPVAVIQASSAQEALALLHSPENVRPVLILLDLKMPGINGLAFLQTVKEDPALRDIPIVALTASDRSRDIASSFDLGIAGYMVKSPDFETLARTVRTIQDYWSINRLPACVAQ